MPKDPQAINSSIQKAHKSEEQTTSKRKCRGSCQHAEYQLRVISPYRANLHREINRLSGIMPDVAGDVGSLIRPR